MAVMHSTSRSAQAVLPAGAIRGLVPATSAVRLAAADGLSGWRSAIIAPASAGVRLDRSNGSRPVSDSLHSSVFSPLLAREGLARRLLPRFQDFRQAILLPAYQI